MTSVYSADRFDTNERMDSKDWVRVRKHLKETYSLLALTTLVAAATAYLQIAFQLFAPWILNLASLVSIAATLGCGGMFGVKYRKISLMAFAMGSGVIIGPLVYYSLQLNPEIIVLALGGSFAIFGSLSMAALFASNKRFLLLGGILSSSVTVLFWMGLASRLFPNRFNNFLQIYAGLFMFCGYVLYDTTQIMHRVQNYSSKDPVQDALNLFINLFGILQRILIILLKKEQESSRRKSRRSNN